MESILDIPKVYTAHAEWLVCIVTILIYRKCIVKKWWNYLLIGGGIAASYGLIRLVQLFCERHDGILWLGGMVRAVLIMIATVNLALRIKWRAAFYIGARMFMWAELNCTSFVRRRCRTTEVLFRRASASHMIRNEEIG